MGGVLSLRLSKRKFYNTKKLYNDVKRVVQVQCLGFQSCEKLSQETEHMQVIEGLLHINVMLIKYLTKGGWGFHSHFTKRKCLALGQRIHQLGLTFSLGMCGRSPPWFITLGETCTAARRGDFSQLNNIRAPWVSAVPRLLWHWWKSTTCRGQERPLELVTHEPRQFRSSGQTWGSDVPPVRWDQPVSLSCQRTGWVLRYCGALRVVSLGGKLTVWLHVDKLKCGLSWNCWGALVSLFSLREFLQCLTIFRRIVSGRNFD